MEAIQSLAEEKSIPETLNPEIRTQISHLLINENDSEELKQRKQSIVDKLPDDLFYQLKGRVHAVFFEKERWNRQHPEHKNTQLLDEGKILRGELFEILVEHDSEITPMQTPVSKEILSLLEDPEYYGLLDEMGKHKNPDATDVYVDERTGEIIIKGVDEAKFGRIDRRSFNQLQGVRQSVRGLVGTVLKPDDPRELRNHGLKELTKYKMGYIRSGKKGNFISLDDANFKISLILPANIEESFESLVNTEETTREPITQDDFNELKAHVAIKHSAFTRDEVSRLADYILSLDVL